MKKLFAGAVILLTAMTAPVMASFNGWTYKRTLTINHSQVSSGVLNYVNFPILDSSTVDSSHLSTGYDIIYTTASDCSRSQIFWDTETVNSITWVNIPLVSSATDVTLTKCYGNPSITTYQGISTATYDSNTVAVWHPTQNLVNNTSSDSTSNNSSGTINGVITSTGILGNSGFYQSSLGGGTGASLNFGNPNSIRNIQVPLTITMWYFPTIIGTQEDLLTNWITGIGGTIKEICLNGSSLFYGMSTSGCSSAQVQFYSGAGTPASLAWHFVTISVSGSLVTPTLTISLDGNTPQVLSPSAFCAVPSNNIGVILGNTADSSNIFPYDGYIDDVTISNIARSNDWLKTLYNSQSSPSTFMTVGPEINSQPPLLRGLIIQGGKFKVSGGKALIR